jgi:hypothetical protein
VLDIRALPGRCAFFCIRLREVRKGPTVSRYGRQPICDVLYQQRWSVKRFADEHGIQHLHLYNCISGRIAVSCEMQELLPSLLGVPLDELFTPRSIAAGKPARSVWTEASA